MLLLARTVHFNAAHRLHRADRSEEWNEATYGAAANPSGYGHNYDLEVTVSGTADPVTGMIVNLTDLDRILKEEVDRPLDHRFLNLEVPEFAGTVPTAEHIALWIWERLAARITKEKWNCRLAVLRLRATPGFAVELVARDLAARGEA